MPDPLTREGSAKELFIRSADDLYPSMTTFLLQEIDRFNQLVEVIRESLDQLKKAIKGLAVMSDELDLMYQSMLNGKVPDNWSVISYPSLKPLGSWIDNLVERIAFIRFWLSKGFMSSYWLPSFFFPQGFMTALLQSYARKYNIAIDKLGFSFEVQKFYTLEEVSKSPGDGVFVYGLFMECARIGKDNLLIIDALPG